MMVEAITVIKSIYFNEETDISVRDIDTNRAVVISRLDDGDYIVKATCPDGICAFFITPQMAKELVEKLGSMIDE